MNMPIANQLSFADQVRIQQHLAQGLPLPPQLQQVADSFLKGDGSFASSLAGQAPQHETDFQLALMANDVYDANEGSAQELEDAGWNRLEPSADGGSLVDANGNEIPIDPAMLSTTAGFDAAIYQNDQGQYVVAFRGTDNWAPGQGSDLDDNLGQGLGFESGQYQDAIALGKIAERVFGDGNVVFTGHSLGGGLASAAALATDSSGVTFNAAGLSDQTLETLGFNPNEVREHAADEGQVRRYVVNGDPLTFAQQDLRGLKPPPAVGHELRVDPASPDNPIGLHGGGGEGASYVEAVRPDAHGNVDVHDPASSPTGFDRLGGAVAQGADLFGNGVRFNLDQDGFPILGQMADALIDTAGDVLGGTISTVGNIGDDVGSRIGEFNVNTLGSALRQGGDFVGDVVDNGSELVSGLADSGREFIGGDRVEGALDAVGDVADFAVDTVGDLADGLVGLAGDAIQNLGNTGGGILRDIGDHTGLEAPLDAVARFMEDGGKVVSDAADTVGDAIDTAADVIGDGVEKAADVAGDVGQAINDGLEWIGNGFGLGGR